MKLLALVTILCTVGCSGIANDTAVESAAQSKGYAPVLGDFSRYPTQHTLMYIHDPRTNQCFAYFWGGGSYGGVGLATVNCGDVHDYLIDIPK